MKKLIICIGMLALSAGNAFGWGFGPGGGGGGTASTATALAADPAGCAGGQATTDINASGVSSCTSWSANVLTLLGAADYATFLSSLGAESATSNDIDPDRLAGDTTDDNLIDAAIVSTLNQNTTGSAATLTTPRTIGGVSFDGSANIDLPGVNTAGNQDTSGTSAGLSGTPAITVGLVTNNGLLPVCLASAPGTPSNGQLACADGNNWQPGGATQGTNDWLVRYKSDGTTWIGIYDLTAGADIVSSSLTITTTGNIATSGNLTGIVPSVVLTHASGVHDGSSNVATLSDSGESFTTNAMVGMTLYNVTDASSCTVTANDSTTITCTLAGGTDNDWDASDAWQVGPGPNQSGSVFYVGLASTIRHPATVGYAAAYMSTTTGVVTVEVADAMTLTYCTAAAVDAGDTIDSPATAGSLTWIHNQSATVGACHGQRNTWTDGGAT